VDAKELDRYTQLLKAKRREIKARAVGTLDTGNGPGGRRADVIDQASQAAQTDVQVHLHQTDSGLLGAIEEALRRVNHDAFGTYEACKHPASTAPWRSRLDPPVS